MERFLSRKIKIYKTYLQNSQPRIQLSFCSKSKSSSYKSKMRGDGLNNKIKPGLLDHFEQTIVTGSVRVHFQSDFLELKRGFGQAFRCKSGKS